MAASFPLVAVDIGNSRVKLGLFERPADAGEFPVPSRALILAGDWSPDQIGRWLSPGLRDVQFLIASVQRTTAARLVEWLQTRPGFGVRLLKPADLPLEVAVERPDLVGIDRLVDAVAANRLRDANRPAIVTDVGSAITVDLVGAGGAFMGGAILPGVGMSARALHEFTDLLPLAEMVELGEPPDPIGRSTLPAIRAGLFWGAVGAMRELIARLAQAHPNPQVFLTGGAAESIAELLTADSHPARFVPHLTLAGIALAAE